MKHTVAPARLLGTSWWQGHVGASAFGVALRLGRLNCLSHSEMKALGLWAPSINAWLHDPPTLERVAKVSRVPESIRQGFPLSRWWPFAGGVPWDAAPWRLRACLSCLKAGYHTTIFQLPGLDCCPWHGETLRVTCPQCDRQLDQMRLLGGTPCLCGRLAVDPEHLATGLIDHIDERTEFLGQVRQWAVEQRSRRGLIAPGSHDRAGWSALQALVEPFGSETLRPFAGVRQAVVVLPLDRPDAAVHDLAERQIGLARLPLEWAPELESVARAVLRSAGAAKPGAALGQMSGEGNYMVSWPVFSGTSALFIDTGALHRQLREDLAKWCSALLAQTKLDLIHWIDGDAAALRVLSAFIRQVLFRTYGECLNSAYRHAFPEATEGPSPPIHRAWGVVERFEATWLGQVAWTSLSSVQEKIARATARFPQNRQIPGLDRTLAELAHIDEAAAHQIVFKAVRFQAAPEIEDLTLQPNVRSCFSRGEPMQLEMWGGLPAKKRPTQPVRQLRLALRFTDGGMWL